MGSLVYPSKNGPRVLDTSLVTFQVIRDIVTLGEVVATIKAVSLNFFPKLDFPRDSDQNRGGPFLRLNLICHGNVLGKF